MLINRTMLSGLLLASVVIGCGGGEPLGRVYGRVLHRGEPVKAGIVVFSNSQLGVHMTADLAEDGTYELQTAGGFGLPFGEYLVAVNPPLPEPPVFGSPEPTPPKPVQVVIPPKYQQLETSGLRLTVVAGENPFNIEM